MKNKYINCKLEYECPSEKWLKLLPTEESDVKYCEKCQKNVYFCKDKKQLHKRIREGAICIAFIKPEKKLLDSVVMGKFPEKPKKKSKTLLDSLFMMGKFPRNKE
jgi:hypothetical protein